MEPTDLILLVSLPLLYLLFMGVEALSRSGRRFAPVRHWRWIGALGLIVTLTCNILFAPLLLLVLPAHSLLDTRALGLWGAAPAVLLTTFFTYWTHRIQHRFDTLWRLGHQLHHSVARVDIASAMIFHPIDILFQASATTLAAWLLGTSIEAAALAGGLGFAIALYQHLNVATPRWAGYLLQRPEAHVLHHERGVHSRNFGDLPLWDMLFGTFANPATADVAVGFEPGRARRVLAMILCRDVNKGTGRAEAQRAAA